MMAPSTPMGTSARRAFRFSRVAMIRELADGLEQLDVGAGQHAVGVDVGDHEARAAGIREEVEGLLPGATLLRPATSSEVVAPHVQTDGDPIPVVGNHAFTPVGLFQGGRANVDASAACGQRPLQ